MTTGSLSTDLRQAAGGLLGKQGLVASRVWSGSDSPPRPPKRYDVLHPPFESSQLKKNGKPFVIPAYRTRIADPVDTRGRGEHPYSWDIARHHTSQYVGGYPFIPVGYGNTGGGVLAGDGGGTVVTSFREVFSANDEIILVNRLRSRMMGSDFDPAAFLATANDSLYMIASSAYRLRTGLALLKKGKIENAIDTFVSGTSTKNRRSKRLRHRNYSHALSPDGMAAAVLETSYGWLPLLSDAKEGAEFVAHFTELPMKTRYRTTYRRVFSAETSSPSNLLFASQACLVRGQLVAHVSEDFSFGTFALSGLDDPKSMAWEALPWSFVADWFIPIQNYLRARAFANRVKGTFTKTTWYTTDLRGIKKAPGSSVTSVGSDYMTYRSKGSRVILSSLPVDLPSFRPLADVPSWRRALNGVSLLTSQWGSSSPPRWVT